MLLLSREDIKKVFSIKDAIEADKKALIDAMWSPIIVSYLSMNESKLSISLAHLYFTCHYIVYYYLFALL